VILVQLFSVYSSNYLSSSSMHVEHDETADRDVTVVQEGEREASSQNKCPYISPLDSPDTTRSRV